MPPSGFKTKKEYNKYMREYRAKHRPRKIPMTVTINGNKPDFEWINPDCQVYYASFTHCTIST